MEFGVVFALGALHGLLLAALLAVRKGTANRLLALLMLVFTVDLAMAAAQALELLETWPHLVGADYPVTLLYGPLLLLYVFHLHRPDRTLRRRDLLHFVPFLALLVHLLPFYGSPAAVKLAYLGSGAVDGTYGMEVINHLKVSHGVGYAAVVVAYYLREIRGSSVPGGERVQVFWIRGFIGGTVLLAVMAGVLHLLNSMDRQVLVGLGTEIYDDLTLLGVTTFVYGIGYMGLYQSKAFAGPLPREKTGRENRGKENGRGDPEERPQAAETNRVRYEKSGLEPEEARRYRERLVAVMEERQLYRDSELKLSDLAEAAEISSHNATQVLNQELQQNFYDFVNTYRVEEVKRRLADASQSHLTILAIAFEAGFNSKSTFHSAFKDHAGETPSAFREASRSEPAGRDD